MNEPSTMRVAEPFVVLMQVTVGHATEWLANNDCNRPIKPWLWADYARRMTRGEWRSYTMEPIKLSIAGRLLDGQHRLRAILETGMAITMAVAFNVPEDCFDVLDSGRKRTVGDQLAASGEAYANVLAAASALVLNYLATGSFGSNQKCPESTPRVRALLAEHPKLRNSLRLTTWVKLRGLLRPSLAVALHYLMGTENAAEAETFWMDLNNGDNLARDDGVFLLRERLLINRAAKAKLPTVEIAALCVKAWRARRDGRPVHSLRWRGGRGAGDRPEGFPRLAAHLLTKVETA